jgi:two-component system chemotaxis response regulator CheB
VIKLLIVDDSALMRRLLGDLFRAEGDFAVEVARDGIDALARLEAFRPDVVTLDVQMPGLDGLACLDRLMLVHPCPVVMVSSLTDDGADATLEALALGAVDFALKPDGAVSLAMDAFGPLLVEKVRLASQARMRRTLRLTERVRLKVAGAGRDGSSRQAPEGPRRNRAVVPDPRSATAIPEEAVGPANGVVLIGASTGGPPALDVLLSPLPAEFPWPIVVAQHMPASFTGALARRLDGVCALTVREVTRPMPLTPGHVYIGRGEADVILSARPAGVVVTAAPSSPKYRWHPSVDRLVASAIEQLGPDRLIGVLVTGMGNDGAETMTRLSRDGGRTIAEAEETAVVWGMPGELVKAGGAQIVAPLDRIAHYLMAWAP